MDADGEDTEEHEIPPPMSKRSSESLEQFLDCHLEVHLQTLEIASRLDEQRFTEAEAAAKAAMPALFGARRALVRLEEEREYQTTHARLALGAIEEALRDLCDRALQRITTPSLSMTLRKLKSRLVDAGDVLERLSALSAQPATAATTHTTSPQTTGGSTVEPSSHGSSRGPR